MKKTVDPPLFYDILRGLKALCAGNYFKDLITNVMHYIVSSASNLLLSFENIFKGLATYTSDNNVG